MRRHRSLPGPVDYFRLAQGLAAQRRYAAWRRKYPVSSLILIVFERVKLPIGFLLFCLVIWAIANEPATK